MKKSYHSMELPRRPAAISLRRTRLWVLVSAPGASDMDPRPLSTVATRMRSALDETGDEEIGERAADLHPGQPTTGLPPHRQVVHRAEEVVDGELGADVAAEHAGLLSLDDHVAEGLVVVPALAAYLLLLLLAELVQRAEEDRRAREVLDGGRDHVSRRRADPLLDR